MIISVKSCNQRGFSTQDGGFAHTRSDGDTLQPIASQSLTLFGNVISVLE